MKIGLLAYHSACNMGATLQLLSSYGYWQKAGHEPIIINWVAEDMEKAYARRTPSAQFEAHKALRKTLWQETELCHTAEEIAHVIETEKIEAVVVGSDAVAQNHPKITRIQLDKKHLLRFLPLTGDRIFPNPFWGTFNDYLKQPVPVAVLSASSQDSAYRLFSRAKCREMAKRIQSYRYISARDTWTQKMVSHITKGSIIPPVTPDPVFAFNYNAGERIASREEILHKFNLPEKYILLSFSNKVTVSQIWLNEFTRMAKEEGFTCVMMPFADKPSFGTLPNIIELPLSPLDWYALIKYSGGYVGHNMHPIVVSIHNNIPFFSFDNYGQRHLNGLFPNDSSSKILHILSLAGLEQNRISCLPHKFRAPKPDVVLNKLLHFDKQKEKTFADMYYNKYVEMMSNIQKSIQHA